MLLPGKYSEERTHEGEYEVRGNLKTFVPEEENTDKWVMDCWMSSSFPQVLRRLPSGQGHEGLC